MAKMVVFVGVLLFMGGQSLVDVVSLLAVLEFLVLVVFCFFLRRLAS